jgi:hypothetical protein
MDILKRLLAAFIVGLALVVAVNLMITAVYHPPGSTEYPVWLIINWFMAVAVPLLLVVNSIRKRALAADDGDVPLTRGYMRNYLEVNVTFYASIALTILFFWNWLAFWFPNEPEAVLLIHLGMWPFFHPVYVAVSLATGSHLWRAPSR